MYKKSLLAHTEFLCSLRRRVCFSKCAKNNHAEKLGSLIQVFKKVHRLAEEFPTAFEYSSGEIPITEWCSNDYLGMSRHPNVINAATEALHKFGSGTGGTRNISENSMGHEKLENRLAELHQKQNVYQAVTGSGNHAYTIQGIRTSQVPKHIFRHNDVDHLEELLSKVDKSLPKIAAFETVRSMTGDLSPHEKLCNVAHKYGSLTFVDQVHAAGLYGLSGAGIGERNYSLHNMDIISGNLEKTIGNVGRYIVGTAKLIDMVISYAAVFIFTTSLPPSILYGALASINTLASEEGQALRAAHQNAVSYTKSSLQSAGISALPSDSHIISIKVGDPLLYTKIADGLLRDKGHYEQTSETASISSLISNNNSTSCHSGPKAEMGCIKMTTKSDYITVL